MIQTSRRPLGARSLVVITTVALTGAVPLAGAGREARADGPVRPWAGRHYAPTHRIARPGRPARPAGPGGPAHRIRRHTRPDTAKIAVKISVATRSPVAPVLPGKVYRWPFVVRNRGNVRADAVTFAAPLSASLQFVSAQQNCSFKDTAAVCQLGSLRPGESKAGVVTAMVADKAPGGQPIDNDALVRWRSTPAQKEGRATAAFPEVKVADTADVSVVKGAPAVVQPGQRVPYQIIVANNGPTAARNVMLTSTSVPVLNLAAPDCTSSRAPGDSGQGSGQGSGPGGNGQGGGAAGSGNLADAGGNGQGAADDLGYAPAPGSAPGLVCQIGTLQPGETRKIMVNAGARAALRPGTVIQAPSQVTTSTIDADLSNNHADVRTTVGAPAVARQVVRRSAPRGLGGARGPGALPSTGAPIGELMHVVIVLLGMGLIFYRVGRRRRGHR